MPMKITQIFSAAIFGMAVIAAPAYADAIADRQEKMKTVGKSMGIVGKMAKGETDFDSAAALAAFVAMKDAAVGFEKLFPAGTETGGETEAAPKLFEDRAGFEEKNTEFAATLEKVAAAAPADLTALQASVGALGKNCGACHKAYRIKKEE